MELNLQNSKIPNIENLVVKSIKINPQSAKIQYPNINNFENFSGETRLQKSSIFKSGDKYDDFMNNKAIHTFTIKQMINITKAIENQQNISSTPQKYSNIVMNQNLNNSMQNDNSYEQHRQNTIYPYINKPPQLQINKYSNAHHYQQINRKPKQITSSSTTSPSPLDGSEYGTLNQLQSVYQRYNENFNIQSSSQNSRKSPTNTSYGPIYTNTSQFLSAPLSPSQITQDTTLVTVPSKGSIQPQKLSQQTNDKNTLQKQQNQPLSSIENNSNINDATPGPFSANQFHHTRNESSPFQFSEKTVQKQTNILNHSNISYTQNSENDIVCNSARGSALNNKNPNDKLNSSQKNQQVVIFTNPNQVQQNSNVNLSQQQRKSNNYSGLDTDNMKMTDQIKMENITQNFIEEQKQTSNLTYHTSSPTPPIVPQNQTPQFETYVQQTYINQNFIEQASVKNKSNIPISSFEKHINKIHSIQKKDLFSFLKDNSRSNSPVPPYSNQNPEKSPRNICTTGTQIDKNISQPSPVNANFQNLGSNKSFFPTQAAETPIVNNNQNSLGMTIVGSSSSSPTSKNIVPASNKTNSEFYQANQFLPTKQISQVAAVLNGQVSNNNQNQLQPLPSKHQKTLGNSQLDNSPQFNLQEIIMQSNINLSEKDTEKQAIFSNMIDDISNQQLPCQNMRSKALTSLGQYRGKHGKGFSVASGRNKMINSNCYNNIIATVSDTSSFIGTSLNGARSLSQTPNQNIRDQNFSALTAVANGTAGLVFFSDHKVSPRQIVSKVVEGTKNRNKARKRQAVNRSFDGSNSTSSQNNNNNNFTQYGNNKSYFNKSPATPKGATGASNITNNGATVCFNDNQLLSALACKSPHPQNQQNTDENMSPLSQQNFPNNINNVYNNDNGFKLQIQGAGQQLNPYKLILPYWKSPAKVSTPLTNTRDRIVTLKNPAPINTNELNIWNKCEKQNNRLSPTLYRNEKYVNNFQNFLNIDYLRQSFRLQQQQQNQQPQDVIHTDMVNYNETIGSNVNLAIMRQSQSIPDETNQFKNTFQIYDTDRSKQNFFSTGPENNTLLIKIEENICQTSHGNQSYGELNFEPNYQTGEEQGYEPDNKIFVNKQQVESHIQIEENQDIDNLQKYYDEQYQSKFNWAQSKKTQQLNNSRPQTSNFSGNDAYGQQICMNSNLLSSEKDFSEIHNALLGKVTSNITGAVVNSIQNDQNKQLNNRNKASFEDLQAWDINQEQEF